MPILCINLYKDLFTTHLLLILVVQCPLQGNGSPARNQCLLSLFIGSRGNLPVGFPANQESEISFPRQVHLSLQFPQNLQLLLHLSLPLVSAGGKESSLLSFWDSSVTQQPGTRNDGWCGPLSSLGPELRVRMSGKQGSENHLPPLLSEWNSHLFCVCGGSGGGSDCSFAKQQNKRKRKERILIFKIWLQPKESFKSRFMTL